MTGRPGCGFAEIVRSESSAFVGGACRVEVPEPWVGLSSYPFGPVGGTGKPVGKPPWDADPHSKLGLVPITRVRFPPGLLAA